MKKTKSGAMLMRAARILLFVIAVAMSFHALGFKRDSPTSKDVTYLNHMQVSIDGGAWQEITLPHQFRGLAPNTPVVLRCTILPKPYDGVYILSQYTQANVFLNDKLVFTFGKPDNYPAFMMNPAAEIHVVETYGHNEATELKIRYLFPDSLDVLSVDPPMMGTSKELILERGVQFGYPAILSMVQIISGVALLVISCGILLIDRKGILFLWLGFFSITTGCWFLGTNQFCITVFPNTALLYLASFIGFSTCMIPLLRFLQIAVNFKRPEPVWAIEILLAVGNITALLLQAFRVYPLHKSWLVFRYLIPGLLLILTVLVLLEQFKWKNSSAGRFIPPAFVLTFSAIWEMLQPISYLNDSRFPILQSGVVIFMLMLGIIAGISVKDSIDLKKRQQELMHEQALLSIQTEEQRKASLHLAENEQELSRQRHDLRHHLTVIQELADDRDALQAYLDALTKRIPKARECFCENSVVNAVVSHYAVICEQAGISFSAKLVVPDTCNETTDSNLCVIFSNLLENAVEACGRMTAGEKFVRIRSTLQNQLLTVTMDNSFSGTPEQTNGRFRSSKRDDYGIGLTSVQSIAEHSHGGTDFHAEGNVFLSSVYLTVF